MLAGGLEDADRSDHVDLGVEGRTGDRGRHVGLRGQVEDGLRLRLGEDVGETRIADVHLDEAGACGDVLPLPGAQVVDDDNLVPSCQEGVDEVRADEPGAPCDNGTHLF